ncbi:MAG: trigger factor, partial [Deltaproteobacteria bacterium]|nr:trigger factor [Deltaproteobacteria bacterium]
DEPIEGIQSSNFLIRMDKNEFYPEFIKALIGLKKGETTRADISFEANHHHAELAGKNVIFKIKIHDIKTLELPELNDTFAESLGADVKNLDELREKIKEELVKRDDVRIDREMKQRLIRKISDGFDFELPESLVKSETDNAMENIRQNLIRSGSNFEKSGISEDRLREELAPVSENKVKEMLILGEIARQNTFTINEMELSEGFREAALNMGQEPDVLRQYYEANGLVESFRAKLLEVKTLNYLVKNANIKNLEPDKMTPEVDAETAEKDV